MRAIFLVLMLFPLIIGLASQEAFAQTSDGSIHGYKFEDQNQNGIDDGEPRLEGVRIFLDNNNNGVLDAGEQNLFTNALGDYWFTDLAPGTYYVREIAPPGFIQTTPNPAPIDLSSGEEYVAIPGQAQLPPNSPKREVIQSDLAFGNAEAIPVGGFGIPIDTTALLIASAQSLSSWMIPVLAGIGIGIFVIKKKF